MALTALGRLLGACAVVATAAMVSTLSSCSGESNVSARVARCRRICEERVGCSGTDGDCFSLCDDLDTLNRATDCYRSYDQLYDCIERFGVCASAEVECESQRDVYSDCIAENCGSDPDREDCAL